MIWSIETENYCITCTTRLPHKLGLWNWHPNFGLRLDNLEVLGSSSSGPNLPGLRLQSDT